MIHPQAQPSGLIVRTQPNSPGAEAYRALFANLRAEARAEGGTAMLFCAPTKSERGGAETVANLGLVAALAGITTLLIDADLRRPSLHSFFGEEVAPGLANLLSGEANLTSLRRSLSQPHLYLLSSGQSQTNAGQLVSSTLVPQMLAEARREYQLTLILAPPVLAVADAAALAPAADGVVLVVDADATRRPNAQQAKAQLLRVHAHLLGIVVHNATNGRMSNEY